MNSRTMPLRRSQTADVAEGARSGAGGGQPFLISDLASVVVDEMEIRGEEGTGRGCWQREEGYLLGMSSVFGVAQRCCSYLLSYFC